MIPFLVCGRTDIIHNLLYACRSWMGLLNKWLALLLSFTTTIETTTKTLVKIHLRRSAALHHTNADGTRGQEPEVEQHQQLCRS